MLALPLALLTFTLAFVDSDTSIINITANNFNINAYINVNNYRIDTKIININASN